MSTTANTSAGLARLSRLLGATALDAPRARNRQRAGTATAADLTRGAAGAVCSTCNAGQLVQCRTASGKPAARPHAARLRAAGLA